MEKRDEHGGVAEGCQCATSACGRREGATYRIVDNRTLLGHDAEHHVLNTAITASKIAGKPDLIYFNNIIEPLVKIVSIINEIIFFYLQVREAAPSSLTLLFVQRSFGGHFGLPVPITMHWPIGQVVPYQRMRGNWHRFAKNATKTDSSW